MRTVLVRHGCSGCLTFGALALVAGLCLKGQFQPFPGPRWTQSSPHISSLSNSAEGNVGASITITGTNFGASTGTVTLSGTTASTSSWSQTSIMFTVPETVGGSVIVKTSAGQTSNSVTFTIDPNLTSLSSTSGYIGSTTNISGTGFQNCANPYLPTVGGLATSWGSCTLVSAPNVQIPWTIGAGVAAITIGPGSNSLNFTVNSPTITVMSPNPATSGSPVTISGQGYGNNLSSLSVTLSGVTETVSSHTSTSITVNVWSCPTHSTLPLTVTVNGSSSGALSAGCN